MSGSAVGSGQSVTISSAVSDITVSSGGTLVVASGGVATLVTVLAGGTEIVVAGGVDSAATLSGGTLLVSSGGTAIADLVASGGSESVLDGGSALFTSVGSVTFYYSSASGIVSPFPYSSAVTLGGALVVSAGGVASGALVSTGGVEMVLAGGTDSSAEVFFGATFAVSSGGTAVDTVAKLLGFSLSEGGIWPAVISSGGTEEVTPFAGAQYVTLLGGAALSASSGTASGMMLTSGETLTVSGGYTDDRDIVSSGGAELVTNGGRASGGIVFAGGTQTVLGGGEAIATWLGAFVESGFSAVFGSGGTLEVSSGGVATGTRVSAGGQEYVLAGGSDVAALVQSGGLLTVSAGGTAKATQVDVGGSAVIASGGLEQVSSGAVASGVTLLAGGSFGVAVSGFADGTQVASGGVLALGSGAGEAGTVISSAGSDVVSAGHSARGGLLLSGGSQTVVDGGTLVGGSIGTFVFDSALGSYVVVPGGDLTVSSGGVVNQGTLYSGTETVLASGIDSGGSFYGGELDISAGGTESGGTIAGAQVNVSSGGRTFDDHLESRDESVLAGGSAVGTVIGYSGSLKHPPTLSVAAGGVVVAPTLYTSGTLAISSGAIASGAITFSGAGTLEVALGAVMAAATISGFAVGDAIDLTGIPPGSAPVASVNSANQMVVSAGGTTYELPFAPGYAGDTFEVTGDTGSGSELTELPCFAAGTRIATARGEVRIEDLAPGNDVHTQAGRLAPVRWLGHRRVDCRRHPSPDNVWPVRVRVGAFGDGLPHRDLLLSPDHAVFFDGVLIPVRYLIDGATIVQEAAESVSYWHVELDRHDLLLAEGLPCESFLDTGNRAAFANGGAFVQMHPDFSQRLWDGDACAPLVVTGPALERARAMLRERARAEAIPVQPVTQPPRRARARGGASGALA